MDRSGDSERAITEARRRGSCYFEAPFGVEILTLFNHVHHHLGGSPHVTALARKTYVHFSLAALKAGTLIPIPDARCMNGERI